MDVKTITTDREEELYFCYGPKAGSLKSRTPPGPSSVAFHVCASLNIVKRFIKHRTSTECVFYFIIVAMIQFEAGHWLGVLHSTDISLIYARNSNNRTQVANT